MSTIKRVGWRTAAQVAVTALIVALIPTVAYANTALPAATEGVAYSASVSVANNNFTATITAGSLPSGVTVARSAANTATFSGTPALGSAGSYTVTVRYTQGSFDASETYSLTVNAAQVVVQPPVIQTSSLPGGTVGTAYSTTISVTGDSVTVGVTGLPSGLSFNTGTRVISGTPTASGTSSVTITASNSGGSATPVTLSLVIAEGSFSSCGTGTGASITTTTLPNGTEGVAYAQGIYVSGFTAWGSAEANVQAQGLPQGLTATFAGTGSNRYVNVSGTPTQTGTFSLVVTVCTNHQTATATIPLTIQPGAAPTVVTTSLPDARAAVAYSQVVTFSGTVDSSTVTGLPTGLSYNSGTRTISGTPTEPGTYTITASATNTVGTGTRQISLTVLEELVSDTCGAGQGQLSAGPLPNARVNQAYTTGQLAASDFTAWGTARFTITTGALPAGLSIQPYGSGSNVGIEVVGTPTQIGSFSFTVTLCTNHQTATRSYTLVVEPGVAPTITPGSIPAGWAGQEYSQTFSAADAVSAFTAAGLPDGFSFDGSTGELTGSAPAGSYDFSLSATNARGTTTENYTLVLRPAPSITSGQFPSITAGDNFAGTVTANGENVEFSISGADGFTIDPQTGELTASNLPAGVYTVTVTATNPAGSDSITLTITSFSVPSIVGHADLKWSVGASFLKSLEFGGNFAEISLTSGALPPGISLILPDGVLAGTPTQPGIYTFEITVSNGAGEATAQFTMEVVSPTTAISRIMVNPGGSITVTGEGFIAEEDIEIWVWSTPTFLTALQADEAGSFRTTVTLPASITPGEHRIEARGALTGSQWHDIVVVAADAPIIDDDDSVDESPLDPGAKTDAERLASTGGQSVDGLWMSALLFGLLGAALVRLANRQRGRVRA